jgi:hypothetical protein
MQIMDPYQLMIRPVTIWTYDLLAVTSNCQGEQGGCEQGGGGVRRRRVLGYAPFQTTATPPPLLSLSPSMILENSGVRIEKMENI